MKTLEHASGLPAQPLPLIGRGRDVVALRELLLRDEVRLVTITGAAGIGKTRLAVAVAADVEACFPAGSWFIDLSSLTDPARVMVRIGKTLGLLDLRPQTALERMQHALRDQVMLLILDTFEPVLAAGPGLTPLLGACHGLKLLVTSRAPLLVRWEHVFPTPPLDLPDLDDLPAPDQLCHVPAVALFLDRAEAAGAALRLAPENARAVAELCVRLDGLPLALELAATQSRLVAPEALLARLAHPLDLLTNGPRDQPARHRTLRAAIGWSYRLLSSAERALFRRLSVFVGGLSLDAAVAVAPLDHDRGAPSPLDQLGALVDQNLLRRELLPNGEVRFRMLDTIREYACERLTEAGELDLAERQHATYYCTLAEAAEAELHGPAQVAQLDLLERERPNLLAALTWCARTGEAALGVRLAAALGWFFYLRGGDRLDGQAWLEHFASKAAALPSAAAARARALSAAGVLAQYQRELPAALALQEAALALGQELARPEIVALALGRLAHLSLFRTDLEQGEAQAAASYEQCHQLGDRWGMAFALGTRGLIARSGGRLDAAARALQESLRLFREQGDRWGSAHALLGLGQVALMEGDDRRAQACWMERLRLSRELGNQTGVAHTLDLLATVARQRGEYADAAIWFEEALAIKRTIGDRQSIAWVLQGMGELALLRGDPHSAYGRLRESLLLRREIGEQAGIVASLAAFAHLAAVLRRPRRALRLAGAAEALYKAVGPAIAVKHYSQPVLATVLAPDADIERSQRLLGRLQRTAAWEEGAALSPEQAIAEALGLETELAAPPETGSPLPALPRGAPPLANPSTKPGSELSPADLTRREREVAALLARGYTNRQISDALVITEGSAHLHVVRLLHKLGFHTRAQAAVWAAAYQLASSSVHVAMGPEHRAN